MAAAGYVQGVGGGGGWDNARRSTWASCTWKHREAGHGRPVDRGAWTAKTVKQPPQQPAQPPIRANGTSRRNQHSPGTPTTGLCERGNDASRSTGRSGRQKAATRRNMRREERVTVQGPVKEQQPDGMSHGGGGGGLRVAQNGAPEGRAMCCRGVRTRSHSRRFRAQGCC